MEKLCVDVVLVFVVGKHGEVGVQVWFCKDVPWMLEGGQASTAPHAFRSFLHSPDFIGERRPLQS